MNILILESPELKDVIVEAIRTSAHKLLIPVSITFESDSTVAEGYLDISDVVIADAEDGAGLIFSAINSGKLAIMLTYGPCESSTENPGDFRVIPKPGFPLEKISEALRAFDKVIADRRAVMAASLRLSNALIRQNFRSN